MGASAAVADREVVQRVIAGVEGAEAAIDLRLARVLLRLAVGEPGPLEVDERILVRVLVKLEDASVQIEVLQVEDVFVVVAVRLGALKGAPVDWLLEVDRK